MRHLFVAASCAAIFGLVSPVSADEKAEASGTLKLGDKSYKLQNSVAFDVTRGNKKRLVVLLSEKPADMAKLKKSLKAKGNDDDYFLFEPHLKLIFDEKGALFQVVIFADGANINEIQSDNFKATVAVKDGVASGKGNQVKPDKFFGKEFTFEVAFDAKMIKPE